jgi:hypothetical protein
LNDSVAELAGADRDRRGVLLDAIAELAQILKKRIMV